MPIPVPIGRGAGINLAIGNVLQGLTQGEEFARKRQMEQMDFALRLAEMQERQAINQERLKQAQEAREERSGRKKSLEELAMRQFGEPANRLRDMSTGVSPQTQIPSALDEDEGLTAPGPLAQQTTGFLEEQARRLLSQQQAALAFPEKFGESLFRKPDILSPDAEAQKIRIAQGGRQGNLLSPEQEAQQVRIAQARQRPPQATSALSPEFVAQTRFNKQFSETTPEERTQIEAIIDQRRQQSLISDVTIREKIKSESKNAAEEKTRQDIARIAVPAIDDLIATLRTTPTAVGFSGALSSKINSVAAQMRNLAAISGAETGLADALNRFDPRDFEDTFGKIGITNEQIKSDTFFIAMLVAESQNIRGRSLTDDKIRRVLEQIGSGQQDARSSINLLARTRDRIRGQLPQGAPSVPPRRQPRAGETRGFGPATVEPAR